jgi:hypothetical protein
VPINHTIDFWGHREGLLGLPNMILESDTLRRQMSAAGAGASCALSVETRLGNAGAEFVTGPGVGSGDLFIGLLFRHPNVDASSTWRDQNELKAATRNLEENRW